MEPWKNFISFMARGGFGYFWVKNTNDGNKTIWWQGNPPEPPKNGNVYFGVNPSKARRGGTERARNEDIAQVNGLYAEFDAKDYEGGKDAALAHVRQLSCKPSVLIDSGGGYHAYWLLAEPFVIKTSQAQQYIADIQARWVAHVGGDLGARDLARVLRVPGTLNYKYDPPREVIALDLSLQVVYSLDDLVRVLPIVQPPSAGGGNGQHSPVIITSNKGDSAAAWIAKAQARRDSSQDETALWLGVQLRDDGFTRDESEDHIWAFLRSLPQLRAEQPWTYTDARRLARSAFSRPAREPARNINKAVPSNGNGHRTAQAPVAELDAPEEPPAEERPAEAEELDQLPPAHDLEFERVMACFWMEEVGDADLLTDLFSDHIIYDHSEKRWYIWRGHYWERDRTGYVYQLVARRVAPQYLLAATEMARRGEEKVRDNLIRRAAQLRSRHRIEAVLDLASKNFRMGLTGEEWDRDPWLLACPNGVIELRSGNFRAGRPRDYLRAKTATSWAGLDVACPTWQRFINDVFGNSRAVSAFVARLLGYGITGLSEEHIFPILWGEGGNGKTTLLETLAKVLGPDITSPTQAEDLMATDRARSGPQPFLYDLRGKRLVWASESGEGSRIDEGLVKRLSGGDRIKVRTLYTEPVEFDPTHLIMLLTNHRPHINADGRAIWRRVLLIPFEESFVAEPAKPHEHLADPTIKYKLIEEAPGILAWLVLGCLEWQETGLQPPDEIKLATAAYREEEDVIGHFLSERCEVKESTKVKSSILYAAYTTWSNDSGIKPMSLTAFGQRIRKRFTTHENHGVWYDGLSLRD